VNVLPSRVEGGAVVIATTNRYAAVVRADGMLRAARPWSAEQPARPGLQDVQITRLACGRDCIAVMTAAGRVMAAWGQEPFETLPLSDMVDVAVGDHRHSHTGAVYALGNYGQVWTWSRRGDALGLGGPLHLPKPPGRVLQEVSGGPR
jgi:hypothetical protein